MRNLLALALAAFAAAVAFATPVTADDKPDAAGFVDLFNGKDLTGWKGLEGYWEVKDGVIRGFETKDKSKQTFLVWTGGTVKDFELRLKFKFNAVDGKVDGNSGIQFRSKILDEKKDPYRAGGYQADFDATNKYTGIIYDEGGVAGGRGIMSNRGDKTTYTADGDPKKPQREKLAKSDAEIKDAIKIGDWNDVVLTVKGNHIVYQINGVTTTEVVDDSPKAVKEGILALQLHAGYTMDIQFKDIKLKKLD